MKLVEKLQAYVTEMRGKVETSQKEVAIMADAQAISRNSADIAVTIETLDLLQSKIDSADKMSSLRDDLKTISQALASRADEHFNGGLTHQDIIERAACFGRYDGLMRLSNTIGKMVGLK